MPPDAAHDQLAAIKARFGHRDLTPPLRSELRVWLEREAVGLTEGSALLERLLDEMRARRIVVPGVSVALRMAAEAMVAAETAMIANLDARLDAGTRDRLDALLSEKTHVRQSRFSWLREPAPRVGSRSLLALLDRIDLVRATGAARVEVESAHRPRMAQLAREGARYTAQAFQQMRPTRRRMILVATLREMEVTLTDAAISMFASLVGRSHLRARKRLDQRIAASVEEGRERLLRIAGVLEAVTRTAREGGDIAAAVAAIAPFDTIDADAALLRGSAPPGGVGALAFGEARVVQAAAVGRLTGSVCTTRARASSDMVRRVTAHSSLASSISAPTSRMAAASFGKMPTTSERRLISRPIALEGIGRGDLGPVLAREVQCQASTSSRETSIISPSLGCLARSASATSPHCFTAAALFCLERRSS